MQRYFAEIINNEIRLGDDDVHHLLHVMRVRAKEEIEVVADGKLYSAIVKDVNPLKIVVNYEISSDSEIGKDVTLFFALAKGDKIDFVIQKATELGVTKIVLIKTERCVVKFDDKDFSKKLVRYEKIAKEASEQCHRLRIPGIVGVIDINNIPQKYLSDVNLLAYEKEAGKTSLFLKDYNKYNSVSIMIGPEGGFSEKEIQLLVDKYQFKTISLGKRILRTETAAVYALSVISYLLEQ